LSAISHSYAYTGAVAISHQAANHSGALGCVQTAAGTSKPQPANAHRRRYRAAARAYLVEVLADAAVEMRPGSIGYSSEGLTSSNSIK
jgi:hypothetical protein